MSLSNNTTIENPCKKWIEYKAVSGKWTYWDKASEQNIEIENPKFIVLDELSVVTGFHDPSQSGIYSNEVHSTNEQILKVKSFKGGLELVGLYKDIKPSIISAGGKFAKSVYALLETPEGLELVNLKLKGVAFGGWENKEGKNIGGWMHIKFKPLGRYTVVAEYVAGKKGNSNFVVPVFADAGELPKDVLEYAIGVDKELQEYFKAYEKKSKSEESTLEGINTIDGIPIENVDLEKMLKDEIGVEELSSVNPLLQNPKKEIKSTSDSQPGTESDNTNLPF